MGNPIQNDTYAAQGRQGANPVVDFWDPCEYWIGFLAKDGSLVLVVALIPALLAACLPNQQATAAGISMLVAFCAAFVRAGLGTNRIRKSCGGKLPVLRQVALALAIILLMIFEFTACALSFAPDVPLWGWGAAALLLMAYLLLAGIALYPSSSARLDGTNSSSRDWLDSSGRL